MSKRKKKKKSNQWQGVKEGQFPLIANELIAEIIDSIDSVEARLEDICLRLGVVEREARKREFTPRAKSTISEHWDQQFALRMYSEIANIANIDKPDFVKWARAIYLMRVRDKRSMADISDAFDRAMRDRFWRSVISDPFALSRNYNKLMMLKDNTESEKNLAIVRGEISGCPF